MFRWRRMIDLDDADAVTAQKDVEVFRLVDCEGLTPLLTLHNRQLRTSARTERVPVRHP